MQILPVADVSRRLAEGQALRLIDVRTPAEFASGHARGAISMPLDQLDPAALAGLSGQGPIYVICRSGMRSEKACRQLVQQDFGGELVSIAGGTDAWARAGLPMEMSTGSVVNGSNGQALSGDTQVQASARIAPQTNPGEMDAATASRVRLIAGSLVLLGVVLGYALHPSLHLLSGVIGLGLIHAGASGTCLMGTFLGRLAQRSSCAGGACQAQR
jgi:rhodanese-related sulfurtransferase